MAWYRPLADKSNAEWIALYERSHQHPANRFCHSLGIPLIILSLLLLPLLLAWPGLWQWPLALFVLGWVLQFIGHAFERKPPEFFADWRFLLVGARWWVAKALRRLPE